MLLISLHIDNYDYNIVVDFSLVKKITYISSDALLVYKSIRIRRNFFCKSQSESEV